MPRYQHIATGSNTTVKTGAGQVYGMTVGGVNGATAFLMDSVSIGVAPAYPTLLSSSSNILTVANLAAGNPEHFPTYGASFVVGLTVAATSNAPVTVYFD